MVHVFSTLVHVSQTVYVHSMYYLRMLHAFDTFHPKSKSTKLCILIGSGILATNGSSCAKTSQESFGRLELLKELYHMCDRVDQLTLVPYHRGWYGDGHQPNSRDLFTHHNPIIRISLRISY